MEGYTAYDQSITALLKEKNIPIVAAWNKIDCQDSCQLNELTDQAGISIIPVSALTGQGIDELKNLMIKNLPNEDDKFRLVGDLINPGDFVVLVVPIDKAAPKQTHPPHTTIRHSGNRPPAYYPGFELKTLPMLKNLKCLD